MTGKIEWVKEWGDTDIFILSGTDKAVQVVWGFSTGSELGQHNQLDTFAIATLGRLVDDNFIPDDDALSLGWDPDSDDVDWDAYGAWCVQACQELFQEA